MNLDETVEDIFSKKSSFEREVLNIAQETDRVEVMKILSSRLVDSILKEHINFLHIKKLSDFTLKHIVNILFKEMANEWVSFAIDILDYSKEEALAVLQKKDRIKFIHAIAEEYFRYYKDYIYEEIADSFISLLGSMSKLSDKIILVNAVINSDLIANRSILGINSFDQLYRRVISAKNLKSTKISSLQIKLSDILIELDCNSTKEQRREDLLTVLPKYEEKNKKMLEMKIDNFDASLQRVKRAIFNSLKNGVFGS